MSVKIKIFKLDPSNSEEASKFMDSVNVIQNGILLSQDSMGILYKDRDEVGMSRENLATAISGELAKSQNTFAIQEGLVRSYTDMIKHFSIQQKDAEQKGDEVQKELDAYMLTYDKTLETEVSELLAKRKEAEIAHQQAPKPKKEELLKPIYDINEVLKELEPKLAAYKTSFDAGVTELTNRMGIHRVDSANLMGRVKENNSFLEAAIDARDHAGVFIKSSKLYIADILAGNIEGLE